MRSADSRSTRSSRWHSGRVPASTFFDAGVSSNGRTLVFGASYLGSNPGTPATFALLPTVRHFFRSSTASVFSLRADSSCGIECRAPSLDACPPHPQPTWHKNRRNARCLQASGSFYAEMHDFGWEPPAGAKSHYRVTCGNVFPLVPVSPPKRLSRTKNRAFLCLLRHRIFKIVYFSKNLPNTLPCSTASRTVPR